MTFLVNEAMVDIGIGTAGLVALMGYLVVFFGLVLLMIVVMIMGKIMVASKTKQTEQAAAEAAGKAAEAPAAPAPAADPAPGSAGEIKLHGVAPRDAAMIMAIVADKMGKPINELRFKSIKEVK